MKSAKLIIFIIFVAFASCNKGNDTYKSVGIITGEDLRMCVCCGGYFINIDDVEYLINSMPKNSNLNLQQETFPITVHLDWQLSSSSCPNLWIDVLRIKKN